MPAGWCAVGQLAHDGAQGARSVQGWITGAHACPRYTLHLEIMGTLSDRLAALIAEMEESDRRLAALVADTRDLIARTEAELAEERPE